MTSRTLLRQPLAQAAQSDTSRLADDELRVLQTTFNNRPELVDVGTDKLGAPLDGNTESHQGRLAHAGVAGHVDLELVHEGREDLGGRESLGQGVQGAEGEARWRVLVNVLGVFLGTDRKQTFNDGPGEGEVLHLALFATLSV